MLQHEVMVADEWRDNGPQDLVTVSLCIQIAINKMHLFLLSIAYACPDHNPTATMGHSVHNIGTSKSLAHTTPHTLSSICLVQWKPVVWTWNIRRTFGQKWKSSRLRADVMKQLLEEFDNTVKEENTSQPQVTI